MRKGRKSQRVSYPARIRLAVAVLSTLQLACGLQARGQTAQPRGVPDALQQGTLDAVRRIAPGGDLSVRRALEGHRTAWSVPENDLGPVTPSTPLHLQLLLNRDSARDAAFRQRLADQQDPASPHFHQWLTPREIGTMYGPASEDLAAIRAWLAAQGLRVESVAPSGIFVSFSGPAAAVERAFETSLHLYRVPGGGPTTDQVRRAPTTEPTVPAAFQPVIGAIQGLAEMPLQPAHSNAPDRPATPNVTAESSPLLTTGNGSHYIAPADFATIYDLNPLYNAGINGSGVRVAIIGQSQINPSDISTFETMFSLPATAVNVVIPSNGVDPGQQNNDYQSEATLDVERVIGTAPGAQPDLVVSSESSGGLITAMSYNVQVLLDPIMTLSYINCELNAGQAMTNFYANLFSQGAAEGISTFVSAGDSGAAGCEPHNVAPAATQLLSINAYCSSGFVTCVGGTEFSDSANPHTYWANINGAGMGSALGYIPEGVWNDPTSSSGSTQIDAGGGGQSIYITKPAFQTGTGVPADGYRDTPDISFAASGAHDAYAFCYLNSSSGPCVPPNSQGAYTVGGDGGTSASAPSMAGIAALLVQKLGAQGALNPLIYRLANRVYGTAFHDVTQASSAVSNCTSATPTLCNNSTPGQSALTGGLPGYLVTVGYDLATGWGSLDVASFYNAALTAGAPTTTTLSGSSGTFAGAQTLNYSATVASLSPANVPTGGVQFYVNGVPSGNLQPLSASGQATYAASTTAFPLGADRVTATYDGDSTFEGSTSNQLSLNVAPAGTTAASLALTATPLTADPTMMVTVTAAFTATGASGVPAGAITLNAVEGGLLVPNGTSHATPLTRSFQPLSAGQHTFVATYPGDSTYAAVTSAPVTVSVAPLATTTALSAPVYTSSSSSIALSATVSNVLDGSITEAIPRIQFFNGTAFVGSAAPTFTTTSAGTITAIATFNTMLNAGTYSLTAYWPGDLYTTRSQSAALTVVSSGSGFTVTPATQQVTLSSAGATAVDVLTVAAFGGFSGTANLSCAVINPASTAISSAPTCSLSNPSVTLPANGTATSTLTLSTTAGTQAVIRPKNPSPGERGNGSLLFCTTGILSLLARRRRVAALQRSRLRLLTVAVAACCFTLGCQDTPKTVTLPTTAATYVVNISGGSSGNATLLSSVVLTVQ